MTTAPRILWLGQFDWGNLCNRVARALNQHHGETVARVWTHAPHPFGYPEDATGETPPDDIVEFARTVNWLIASGDGDYWYFDRMREKLMGGRSGLDPLVHLGTTHAGSAYRGTPDLYNEADARRGFEVRFIGLDSLRFAPDDPTVRPHLSPAPGRIGGNVTGQVGPRPLRVAHAPSNRAAKGTEVVLAALRPLVDAGTIELDLIEGATHAQCRARLSDCAILLDQFNPSIGGMGALAVEAMSVGVAVISDVRHIDDAAWSRLPVWRERSETCGEHVWSMTRGPGDHRVCSKPTGHAGPHDGPQTPCGLPADRHAPEARAPIIDVRDPAALVREVSRLVGDPVALQTQRMRGITWAHRTVSPAAIAELWCLPEGLRSAPVPTPPPPKISAPMIVRDEERGIEKALASLVGVVDEVVVVDTGSTDATKEIVRRVAQEWLRGMGPDIRLLEHPWQDDFSEARNFAQDACTGDWCVILDGDEVIEPGDLRASIHAAPLMAVNGLTILLEGISHQVRAYSRGHARWQEPVHNQIVWTSGPRFAPAAARVAPSYNKGTVRIERSRPMLLEHMAANPQAPHAPYYLANLNVAAGDWPEALRMARRAVEQAKGSSGYAASWGVVVMGEYMVNGLDAAFGAVDEALALHPHYADLWHLKANLCALRWRGLLDTPQYLFQVESRRREDVVKQAWKCFGFCLDDDGEGDRSDATSRAAGDL